MYKYCLDCLILWLTSLSTLRSLEENNENVNSSTFYEINMITNVKLIYRSYNDKCYRLIFHFFSKFIWKLFIDFFFFLKCRPQHIFNHSNVNKTEEWNSFHHLIFLFEISFISSQTLSNKYSIWNDHTYLQIKVILKKNITLPDK